jgi:hypothetical protein
MPHHSISLRIFRDLGCANLGRKTAKLALFIGAFQAVAAQAQTIPVENFPVSVPNGVVRMHYADTLCRLNSPAPGPAQTPIRSASTKIGGSTVAEIYTIYAPNVRVPATMYRGVPLRAGDRFLMYACGCVQTGGTGLTWKSYFDPKGKESDHLYSGTFGIFYDNQVPPPGFWQHPINMVRIKKQVTSQGPGLTIPPGRTAYLVLGYEDDDYHDNGYWGHDDGNYNQCRGVGPAIVDVMIYHPSINRAARNAARVH